MCDRTHLNAMNEYDMILKPGWAREMLESGAADMLRPKQVLILEVVSRADILSQTEVETLCEEVEEMYGSVENAIAAIRAGDVELTQVKTH
jgi:hypothetical protein